MAYPGFAAMAFLMAGNAIFRASTHDVQNPKCTVHPLQISEVVIGNALSARKFLIEDEPLNERTTNRLVESTATKPVISVKSALWCPNNQW
jgi:hypothetical protein